MTRTRLVAAAGFALLLAACTSGSPLDVTVAGTASDSEARETSATVDADEIAATWEAVDGTVPALPPGQVEVLVVVDYRLWQPEVTEVRTDGASWTVHVSAHDLEDEGCAIPAEVRSVSFLLHVTADAPPDDVRAVIDEQPGCGD